MRAHYKKGLELIRGLRRDLDGASLVEYKMLLAIIVAAVIITFVLVHTWVNDTWTNFYNQLNP